MDRVAQLAEEAEHYLQFDRLLIELHDVDPEKARASTRAMLADKARALGFPELEISAAIDTALKGR